MKQRIEIERPLEKGSYVIMPMDLAQQIRAYLGKRPHDETMLACKGMSECQIFEVKRARKKVGD